MGKVSSSFRMRYALTSRTWRASGPKWQVEAETTDGANVLDLAAEGSLPKLKGLPDLVWAFRHAKVIQSATTSSE